MAASPRRPRRFLRAADPAFAAIAPRQSRSGADAEDRHRGCSSATSTSTMIDRPALDLVRLGLSLRAAARSCRCVAGVTARGMIEALAGDALIVSARRGRRRRCSRADVVRKILRRAAGRPLAPSGEGPDRGDRYGHPARQVLLAGNGPRAHAPWRRRRGNAGDRFDAASGNGWPWYRCMAMRASRRGDAGASVHAWLLALVVCVGDLRAGAGGDWRRCITASRRTASPA